MDSSRFDALSRSLGAARSRRGLRRFLGAFALAAPLALRNVAEIAATHKKGKKGKKHKKKRREDPPSVPPVISPPTGPCRAPGAACTLNAQCCAQVCLDNGFCGCFSTATGEIPCPTGCECHQVNPGGVGACVEDFDVTPCCDSLPSCNSNTDCGRTSFCDELVCASGVCVRRCPT